MMLKKLSISITLIQIFCVSFEGAESKSLQYPIRSEAIITHWPETAKPGPDDDANSDQPGWMV